MTVTEDNQKNIQDMVLQSYEDISECKGRNYKEFFEEIECKYNTFFKQVGYNIQNILNAQGKTQQYLADELNISKQKMSEIIKGSKAISVVEISKIASALNVSTDMLLTIEPDQKTIREISDACKIKNEETQKKIAELQNVCSELIMLEKYAEE